MKNGETIADTRMCSNGQGINATDSSCRPKTVKTTPNSHCTVVVDWANDRMAAKINASPSNNHVHHQGKASRNSADYSLGDSEPTCGNKSAVSGHIRRGVKTSTVKKRPSDSALNSVTATLVAVVILFLILVSPCEILKFSLSYTSAADEHRLVTYITNFMQATNFSLNFLLYCAVNKSFRYTLKRLAVALWYYCKNRCCS